MGNATYGFLGNLTLEAHEIVYVAGANGAWSSVL